MKTLTKADLLAAVPKPRPVIVPELGGLVFVRALSGLERDAFEVHQHQRKVDGQPPNFRGGLAARALVNAEGVRQFTDDDEDALGALDSKVLDLITDAASAATGYTEKDVKALGEDSGASPGGASPSDSPAN